MNLITMTRANIEKRWYICKRCGLAINGRHAPESCQLCFYEYPNHEEPDEFRLADSEEEKEFSVERNPDFTFRSIEEVYGVEVADKIRSIYNIIVNNTTESVNDVYFDSDNFLGHCFRQVRLTINLQNIATLSPGPQKMIMKMVGKDLTFFEQMGYLPLRLDDEEYLLKYIPMEVIQDLP